MRNTPGVSRSAASLPMGDRNLPLEMDLKQDIVRDHPMIGRQIEVSPVAGGDLEDKRGKGGKISGVFLRLGEVVAYEVEIEDKSHLATGKDIYTDRAVLVDIQPPTATSASIRAALSFWSQQRTYWRGRLDGLESLCFELATVTPRAVVECFPWGWRFLVPDPMPGGRTVVDCRAVEHNNFWSLTVMVYPERVAAPEMARESDHWARTFSWAKTISEGMIRHGWDWADAARGLAVREKASQKLLRPLVSRTLERCVDARQKLSGEVPSLSPIYSAFSDVRLKAGTIGLTEPPTDRRAYTVVSVSPSALLPEKGADHLKQVVLHECIHIAVSSTGGEPHNAEFNRLSEILGLAKENRS